MKSQRLTCRDVHLPPKCDKIHWWDDNVKEIVTTEPLKIHSKAYCTTDSNIVNPGEID